MHEFLLCKASDPEGRIFFIVYNATEKKIEKYSNDEMIRKIVSREIDNAKLENSVVKITDSKRTLAKLSYEESTRSSVYYVISEYTSPLGSEMYAVVSNTGVIYEFSASAAADFVSDKRMINGYMNKHGLHVINVPVFSTVLHKSLEHTDVN